MIERQVLQGRGATIAYLTAAFAPADRQSASVAKVLFDDGETLWLSRSQGLQKYREDQARDDHGRFADEGGGASTKDVHARLAAAERMAHSIPDTSKIDTPERHALRAKIADDLYNQDIADRKHDRVATVVLGLPGSGKSTIINPILKDMGAIAINADLAKERLPEYHNGVGAFATHEESSGIKREVLGRALRNGDNLVYERVDSPDKINRDIASLKKAGYSVHVALMRVPTEVAEKSVVERFLTEGRYVPPMVVRGFGDTADKAYAAAKAGGLADSYRVYERGPNRTVRLVEP